MTSISESDPRTLLGLSPLAAPLLDYLEQVADLTEFRQVPTPEFKSYLDALYVNYYALGLSLMFVAKDGSKSIKDIDPGSEKLVLDSIDIYNAEPKEAKTAQSQTYALYPAPSLVLSLLPSTDDSKPRPAAITLTGAMTGKEIVGTLGEPDRKGGGAGPSSGSIGIWCEWGKEGIMIEFGGTDARGPQAWERGKDAVWRVVTLFRSKAL